MCPAVGTGWKSFKTTPFLRASVQSISRPCQPPGCRSGHFPGQSHRHCSAWVTAAPPHAGPSFRPCQRPSILPTAAREASSQRAERALLCPLPCPRGPCHTALGPLRWSRDQDGPPKRAARRGGAGVAAGTPHEAPLESPRQRLLPRLRLSPACGRAGPGPEVALRGASGRFRPGASGTSGTERA